MGNAYKRATDDGWEHPHLIEDLQDVLEWISDQELPIQRLYAAQANQRILRAFVDDLADIRLAALLEWLEQPDAPSRARAAKMLGVGTTYLIRMVRKAEEARANPRRPTRAPETGLEQ